MKPWIVFIALLAFVCRSQAQQLPAPSPIVQGVLFQQKGAPFPFASGAALDSSVYAATKRQLQLADQLQVAARRAVDSLKLESALIRKALDDQRALGQHDQQQYIALSGRYVLVQQQLIDAEKQYQTASKAIERIIRKLPARYRTEGMSYEEIALATEQYVGLLQKRKWKWAAAAGAGGFILGLATVFF